MFCPLHVMVAPETVALAVPVFVRVMLTPAVAAVSEHVKVVVPAWVKSAPVRAAFVTETWAVWDDVPKMPKTKPPIATAAMRVTAMISTVAMIGEMAFLCAFLPFRIFITEFSEQVWYIRTVGITSMVLKSIAHKMVKVTNCDAAY